MKPTVTFLIFIMSLCAFSQEHNYRTKRVAVKDSILVDSISINSIGFSVKQKNGVILDTSYYHIDFSKALLTFKKPVAVDSLIIEYVKYPEFLTKVYKQLDESIIVENTNNLDKVYKLSQRNTNNRFVPFDGLTTSGSISRGVTIGNNQNSVLNSELDLQISGKLNDKVSLRASIQDANIPLQESGYSQRLDEFDQIFIELYSKNWNIRAGDIDLQNTQSYFARFSKRVQGLLVSARLEGDESKGDLFAAGALVRGQFSRSQFKGEEGNQGPYKLQGQNGELFVLIVSGSETVYVNGIPVERGENKDYVIDYNAGEIRFNATYPITSEMRITVDYQFSDRNYSRFVGYGGGTYQSESLQISASVYTENDAKNQPLQQNLSTEQIDVLKAAGDDKTLMVAPSAIPETYSENRILYKKEIIGGLEVFVFSNDPDDDLFSLKFVNVGLNQGNYRIVTEIDGEPVNAIETIYEYVAPIAGEPQGSFEPIVQLIAPVKLQMAVIQGAYKPTEKTTIDFELAASKNDLNLFSSIDDGNNNGFAGKLKLTQSIIKKDSTWNLNAFVDGDYIHKNFRTIERLYNAEFNRDWNLDTPIGDQQLLKAGAQLGHFKKGIARYQFEHLNYSENFNGNRHVFLGDLQLGRFHVYSNTSLLSATSNLTTSTFSRSFNRLTYNFDKAWIGTKLALENNQQKEKSTNLFTNLSQKFTSYEAFTGLGDSTNVFIEIGYKHRVNDSLRNEQLQRVNSSNTYYLKSKLIKNKHTDLGIYLNYRTLKNVDGSDNKERSLNSRLQYSQKLFNNIVLWNTVFETNSGTLPQQEFTYVEVEPGRGAYTWIDYNGNGIQELEEFELAQFQDQGTFIRVLLPNQIFLRTHQNRLSQTLTINPSTWSTSDSKSQKFWSHFYNQTSYLIDRKIKNEGNNFNLNPFDSSTDKQLGLQLNFRNILFFNRGKQRYTTSYTYLSNKSRNVLTFGYIENNLKSHQLDFTHKMAENWLVTLKSAMDNSESETENFSSKNFKIEETRIFPKLSYLFNDNVRFDLFYQYAKKDNTIGDLETLKQQKYGLSFSVSKQQKAAINAEFNYFSNEFSGNANSPVGYQMLEGLQPGTNFTWTVLAQKKLTKFLDLNLNYFGRKSENAKAIHSGTVQLKAYF